MSTRSNAHADDELAASSSVPEPEGTENDSKKKQRVPTSPRRVGALHHQLYRVVLHSIAAFLGMTDVLAMARTNKQWLTDLPSMPIRADGGPTIKTVSDLRRALESRFAKHATHAELSSAPMWELPTTLLAQLIASNPPVTHLNLQHNQDFDCRSAQKLADALVHNRTLRVLNVTSTNIGAKGAIAIVEGLVHNQALTSLNMRSIPLVTHSVVQLTSALAKNRTLQNVDLSFNCTQDDPSVHYAHVLWQHPALTSLSLRLSNITATGTRTLLDAARQNPARCLRALNLGHNTIESGGIDAIAEAIRDPTCALTSIDLHDVGMDSSSAIAVADALKSNSTITQVDVSFNEIFDAGGLALARMLDTNTTITELKCASNYLGRQTMAAFAQLIARTHSLTCLDLSGNDITDMEAMAFADALAKNHSLTSVDLGCSQLSSNGIRVLLAMLAKNQTLTRLALSCYSSSLSLFQLAHMCTDVRQSCRVLFR